MVRDGSRLPLSSPEITSRLTSLCRLSSETDQLSARSRPAISTDTSAPTPPAAFSDIDVDPPG